MTRKRRTNEPARAHHAGHTQGLAAVPRAWEAHVIGFLDAALISA